MQRDLSSHEEMSVSNAKRIRFYARLFQRMQAQEGALCSSHLLRNDLNTHISICTTLLSLLSLLLLFFFFFFLGGGDLGET